MQTEPNSVDHLLLFAGAVLIVFGAFLAGYIGLYF
jgi:hypothetical protein